MPNHPPPFKQQYLARALRGAIDAGLEIHRIEIENTGKIVLITSAGGLKELNDELNRELIEFEAIQSRRRL
jgi:hypothetical protein